MHSFIHLFIHVLCTPSFSHSVLHASTDPVSAPLHGQTGHQLHTLPVAMQFETARIAIRMLQSGCTA